MADGEQIPILDGEVPFRVGIANSEIDFSNPDERLRWLQTQPADVAWVIAARAALRALPGLSLARGSGRSRLTRRRMILRVFRAVDAAWAVSAFPGSRDALRNAARQASSGMGDLQATPVERAAAYALATLLASNTDTPARASTAIGYALDMAGEGGKLAFETMLDAIETDANLLRERFSPVTMATSQLWRNRPPEWAIDRWEELKRTLIAANEGWHVWSLWYENRLFGHVIQDQLEVSRALIDDELWHQEPRIANTRIQELLDKNQNQPGLQGVGGTGVAGEIRPQASSPPNMVPLEARATISLGAIGVSATAEVVDDPAIEAVARQIKGAPQVFEQAARFAARSIERELETLAAKIPNEPEAIEGYREVRAVLQRLQKGFEGLAASVEEAREVTDEAQQTVLLKKVARTALAMCNGFVDWFDENGNRAGRVIAELGLAGVISGTLSYFAGIPPMLSFPVTVAAMSGQSIWEAIKAFAPNKDKK
ncbi:hypothetical protein [Bradyrhizobium diazoefficiens]